MQRTIAVLLCALLLFSAAVFPAAAADDAYTYPEPEVLEIDLYIQPYHYLEMISGTDEDKRQSFASTAVKHRRSAYRFAGTVPCARDWKRPESAFRLSSVLIMPMQAEAFAEIRPSS